MAGPENIVKHPTRRLAGLIEAFTRSPSIARLIDCVDIASRYDLPPDGIENAYDAVGGASSWDLDGACALTEFSSHSYIVSSEMHAESDTNPSTNPVTSKSHTQVLGSDSCLATRITRLLDEKTQVQKLDRHPDWPYRGFPPSTELVIEYVADDHDDNRRDPGQVIARYVRSMLPEQAEPSETKSNTQRIVSPALHRFFWERLHQDCARALTSAACSESNHSQRSRLEAVIRLMSDGDDESIWQPTGGDKGYFADLIIAPEPLFDQELGYWESGVRRWSPLAISFFVSLLYDGSLNLPPENGRQEASGQAACFSLLA